MDGVAGVACYVGPPVNGLSQFNVFLPPGVRTGLVPVRVEWQGQRLCPDAIIRVIPAGPAVPRLISVSDGVNLLSTRRIESGTVKATIDEVESIGAFTATVDGIPVRKIETFRTDPLASRYEVNFLLPEESTPRRTRPRNPSRAANADANRNRGRLMLLLAILTPLLLVAATPETQLRTALATSTGTVTLPAGIIEISREIILPTDAHDLDVTGPSTTIKAASTFRGRALIVIPAGKNIRIHDVSLDGNRDAVARPLGLPPSEAMFSRFTPNNGLLAEGVTNLEIADVKATGVAGFTILINSSHTVRIHGIQITGSGSLNLRKRNNTTGGILLEEGTTDFEILDCRIADVRGNGIWTHSLYTSARNARGRIAGNEFAMIARDAIQVGHATEVRVENNRGRMIGYPTEEVDLEGQAFPVAVDTAGNVDRSVYRNNQFEEIDGKCFDLDGFHDGEVSGNTCLNEEQIKSYPYGNFGIIMNNSNPDMQSRNIRITGNTIDGSLFGGIFIIGSGHTVTGNHLTRLNRAHCGEGNAPGPFNCNYTPDQPDLLRSGIYLGAGAERPDAAKGNTVENNEIAGYGMSRHCIGTAPGVLLSDNTVAKNDCSDEAAVARARFSISPLFATPR